MSAPKCPGCGRTYALRSTDVLRFIQQQPDIVRTIDVAEHFGVDPRRASVTLCKLVDRGLLARVRPGQFTSDMERGRQVLLEQLNRLTPA
ncbi:MULTISPECIES: type IV toxin-antitoxin system AbiEi family antitoxin domain-containing protein [unclassified Mycolicibacterium]|uniref:type IV toxin-antitoxin system AbiEi family antitoxin domain-containing protein n=1 Tax=unclassified Mycolicibacterium TaxID=2636767 RepID=UPI0035CC00A8